MNTSPPAKTEEELQAERDQRRREAYEEMRHDSYREPRRGDGGEAEEQRTEYRRAQGY